MAAADELFERNLDFFKIINPALAERLSNHEALSKLVFDEDGEPDVLFQGMKLYGKGAQKHVEQQIEQYWNSPGVITLTYDSVANMDSEGTRLLNDLKQFAEDNAVTFNEQRTTRNAFHLVVQGVGLGQHIEPLLADVKPRNLVLIEPNMEFLYQSLFCLDWKRVIGKVLEDGGNVHILTDGKSSGLIYDIRRIYTQYGRASFDGLTVYTHYENPAFYAVEKFLATQGEMLFSGLGFFEDELNMVANTYNNLKSGEEKVFLAHLDQLEFPVFIVGSGPSLDGSIEVIKANQNRAVIISCGTALLPLMRAGIKPDFHAELERGKVQIEIPEFVAQEFDISDVCLVGSTTLVPGVKEVFAKRVYYFRHMLSSFPVFSGNLLNCLRFPGPSVGNTGTSFAQDSGFRQYYFFGMDLGFVDETQHHSANTVYMEKGVKHESPINPWDRTMRGNFGGSVKAAHIYEWSRDTLEVSITNSSIGHTYYNCSDGAYIEGTVPLLPEFVDLPEPSEPKPVFVERMMSRFPVYTKQDFEKHWQDGKIIQDVREICDQMIASILDNSDLSTKRYIGELMKVVRPLAFDNSAALTVRGSTYLLLVVGEYFIDRIEQYDKKADLIGFLRDAYCRGIESMRDEVDVEISALQNTGRLLNRESWD
ncbi:motility associated factor glycosyltransferase family protein [Magnetovibrio sp.]|uniref:motility associated factor glycosyltransferase family protein n=1 Tax=Magnetovibrio sp. TaxID=2024836 RepID=UPI002F9451DA